MRYQPHLYTAIEAWGSRLGSYRFYIHCQQVEAAKDDAPLTSIYKGQDGRWVTIADIEAADTRADISEASARCMAQKFPAY